MTMVTVFMEQIKDDPRIGPLHISLYMALVYSWQLQGGEGPVSFKARELLPMAKVAAPPFHRCIRQLHSYGYIVYEPSLSPRVKSRVWLVGGKDMSAD